MHFMIIVFKYVCEKCGDFMQKLPVTSF